MSSSTLTTGGQTRATAMGLWMPAAHDSQAVAENSPGQAW